MVPNNENETLFSSLESFLEKISLETKQVSSYCKDGYHSLWYNGQTLDDYCSTCGKSGDGEIIKTVSTDRALKAKHLNSLIRDTSKRVYKRKNS